MNTVDIDAFKYAVGSIDNGNIFEGFSQTFLAAVLGHEFMPVGGLKDRGIDGLEFIFGKKPDCRTIYQVSIEKDCKGKLDRSLEKLKTNKIEFDRFVYVTNRVFPEKDKTAEEYWETYKTPIQICDLSWFVSNANHSEATINAYQVFVDSYLHEFQKPGTEVVVADLVGDPRLFVFLRQQWEAKRPEDQLDEMLADTLILYALEGTDPDKNILRSKEEIIKRIATHLKFEPKLLGAQIDRRLGFLSKKPHRKIKFHSKDNLYCLPFETRQELLAKNLKDKGLHDSFKETVAEKLKFFLKESVNVDLVALIDSCLNKIFYKQGLEFAELMSSGHSKQAFERSLPETISEVVDSSQVPNPKRALVKQALLATIRDLVYNGTHEQKEFLRSLSNTYMLLFLLQCDPKVATYFASMAGKLNVFVCTSILVPALSEVLLSSENRRYWNLLVGAHRAGVKLKINDTILDELVGHFKKIKAIFQEEYAHNEIEYTDEIVALYIPEIILRAYFYGRARGKVNTFDEFLDNFCSPDLRNAKQELIDLLSYEFGISYAQTNASQIKLDTAEETALTQELEKTKGQHKAKNDARLILTIFSMREQNKEADGKNLTGYATWWLSTDISTQRAVNKLFKNKYEVSCYMRPDFLYNYVALGPSPTSVKSAFADIFPNLLGVNISHALPEEVVNTVHRFINEHGSKNQGRVKSIIRNNSDRLKSDPNYQTKAKLESFLNEELQKLSGG